MLYYDVMVVSFLGGMMVLVGLVGLVMMILCSGGLILVSICVVGWNWVCGLYGIFMILYFSVDRIFW